MSGETTPNPGAILEADQTPLSHVPQSRGVRSLRPATEGVALLPCPFCGSPAVKDYGKLAVSIGCDLHECPSRECYTAGPKEEEARVVRNWNTRTAPPARTYAEGVAMACAHFEQAIGDGYPLPADKTTQCAHGQFGWEDCIACYDDALIAKIAAIRLLSQGEKA